MPIYRQFTKKIVVMSLVLLLLMSLIRLFFPPFPTWAQTESTPATLAHLIWQLPGELESYRNVPFVPGELTVGFHGNQARAATLLTDLNAQLGEQLDLRGLESLTNSTGVTGYILRVPEGTEWQTMLELMKEPSIAFVVPNWLVFAAEEDAEAQQAKPEAAFIVNDPKYVSDQWYLQRINASRAWSLAYSTNGFAANFATVQVAIIDSGIDINHPEFRGRLLPGKNYITAGTQPVDDFGHGTHVAGLLGAVFNNATGIAGVAPKVKLDVRKVLSSTGSGSPTNVATAIREAADDGAQIINMSLTTTSPQVNIESAVKYAYNKGVLLIAAAGNDAATFVYYPAAYDEVMAVAATTYQDKRASYSNQGQQIEIAAPGGESQKPMLSAWPGGVRCRDINAPLPQSGYCTSEGTSMAAAVVSGAAALAMSVRPDLNAGDVRQLLKETATPIAGGANLVGSGRLDLHKLLRKLLIGDLLISQKVVDLAVTPGSAPFKSLLRLDNASLQGVPWVVNAQSVPTWLQLDGATNSSLSGAVSYGQPAYLSLTITPTNLAPGLYSTTFNIVGTRSDGNTTTIPVDVQLLVTVPLNLHWYLPLMLGTPDAAAPILEYRWELPSTAAARQVYAMTDNSSVGITMPITVTLRDRSYTDVRISSDGFVSFPGSANSDGQTNRCMPNLTDPAQAVYGWWADLDPGAIGARVSSFPAGADRFVIEFENVPSAATVSSSYLVSFQIVLYKNGDIGLNYRDAPSIQKGSIRATVGVEARDGLFHNQVACKDDTLELGFLPEARQALLIKATEEVY